MVNGHDAKKTGHDNIGIGHDAIYTSHDAYTFYINTRKERGKTHKEEYNVHYHNAQAPYQPS